MLICARTIPESNRKPVPVYCIINVAFYHFFALPINIRTFLGTVPPIYTLTVENTLTRGSCFTTACGASALSQDTVAQRPH